MARTSTSLHPGAIPPGRKRRATWRERVFVLGGLALAALVTAISLALDAGAELLAPLWLAAIAWTVLASLAGALWRGFRHGDWSAFGRRELPHDRHDAIDFSTRTGSYAWLGDLEDRLHDDSHLRDHDHG